MHCKAAGAVRFREEIEIRISARECYLDLACCGEGAVSRRFAVAQSVNGADRRLDELSVPYAEFSWQAHTAFPVLRLRAIVVVGKADPSDQDRFVGIAYVGGALRRIEIKSEVQIAVTGFGCKCQRIVIHRADQVHIVVRALRPSGKLRVLG